MGEKPVCTLEYMGNVKSLETFLLTIIREIDPIFHSFPYHLFKEQGFSQHSHGSGSRPVRKLPVT